jgi:hypothetical protein
MSRYRTIWDICPSQIACEGQYIKPGRAMCGLCERATAKRQALKTTTLLKGERHLATEAVKSLRKKEKRQNG